MDKHLWNYREFKIGDKVKHKYDKWIGIVDAITPQERIRVRLLGTYEWVDKSELEFAEDQIKKDEPKNKSRLDYLG